MKPRQRYHLCLGVALVEHLQSVYVQKTGENAITPYIGQHSESAVLIRAVPVQLVTNPVGFDVLDIRRGNEEFLARRLNNLSQGGS
jgi:hypothetical protein